MHKCSYRVRLHSELTVEITILHIVNKSSPFADSDTLVFFLYIRQKFSLLAILILIVCIYFFSRISTLLGEYWC